MRCLPLFLVLCVVSAPLAGEELRLQLKWLPQAQFAGYYAAVERGLYEKVGLEVALMPGGPGVDPAARLAAGEADVALDWMPGALAARERGTPMVNIAQPFARSGFTVACRRSRGIDEPTDLAGKTLGVWPGPELDPVLAFLGAMGLAREGEEAVRLLGEGDDPVVLLRDAADCVSAMTYNELLLLEDAGFGAEELTVFRLEDHGVALLEDGLWVLEPVLAEPETRRKLARFVAASRHGWEWALGHPDEAVAIVLRHAGEDASDALHQRRMLAEVGRLLAEGSWALDVRAAERTVTLLLESSSDVIHGPPHGAWTDAVTAEAEAGD